MQQLVQKQVSYLKEIKDIEARLGEDNLDVKLKE